MNGDRRGSQTWLYLRSLIIQRTWALWLHWWLGRLKFSRFVRCLSDRVGSLCPTFSGSFVIHLPSQHVRVSEETKRTTDHASTHSKIEMTLFLLLRFFRLPASAVLGETSPDRGLVTSTSWFHSAYVLRMRLCWCGRPSSSARVVLQLAYTQQILYFDNSPKWFDHDDGGCGGHNVKYFLYFVNSGE